MLRKVYIRPFCPQLVSCCLECRAGCDRAAPRQSGLRSSRPLVHAHLAHRGAGAQVDAVADISTGAVIVPDDASRTLTAADITMTAIAGAVTGATGIYVVNTSAVIVFEFLAGALLQNGVVRAGDTSTTIGARWGVPLTVGKGLQVIKRGFPPPRDADGDSPASMRQERSPALRRTARRRPSTTAGQTSRAVLEALQPALRSGETLTGKQRRPQVSCQRPVGERLEAVADAVVEGRSGCARCTSWEPSRRRDRCARANGPERTLRQPGWDATALPVTFRVNPGRMPQRRRVQLSSSPPPPAWRGWRVSRCRG
jgi:hypothetical protein